MVRAHQIIYTSCRRGIEGASDGLQVFSYDEGLREAGLDAGVRWQKLFPFDVPAEAGQTAFGFAPWRDAEACGRATPSSPTTTWERQGGRATCCAMRWSRPSSRSDSTLPSFAGRRFGAARCPAMR